jgi:hypothetical protein
MAREALKMQGYKVKKFPRWASAELTEEGLEEVRKFNELVKAHSSLLRAA